MTPEQAAQDVVKRVQGEPVWHDNIFIDAKQQLKLINELIGAPRAWTFHASI